MIPGREYLRRFLRWLWGLAIDVYDFCYPPTDAPVERDERRGFEVMQKPPGR